MSIVCEAKHDIISYFKQAGKQTLLYSQFVSAASCHDGAGPEPHGARVGPSLPLASPPAQLTTPQAWTPAIGTVGTGLLPLTRYVYEVIGLQGPSTAVHEVSSDKELSSTAFKFESSQEKTPEITQPAEVVIITMGSYKTVPCYDTGGGGCTVRGRRKHRNRFLVQVHRWRALAETLLI
uniref:Uncharacterized protein n=1 Tax=Timema monikensis TaxID=170555 RepID=A0A7R9E8Y8_9NEOP|nr:unnamed protein product [Timema monikensis]